MLEYSKETGMFRHVPPCSNSASREWSLGSPRPDGRYTVWFEGSNKLAHRVAWKLVTGHYPTNTIDHIDYNPGNNKWNNLRDISQQRNNRNIHAARQHNQTGVQGVTIFRNKFRARITVDGKSVHLGTFNTLVEGYTAYSKAKEKYHQVILNQP